MKTAPLFLTIAGAALVLSAPARAETEKAKAYDLKNRSSFQTEDDARIPFWPIGFVRPKIKGDGTTAAPVAVTHKIQLEPGNFSVTSILLGDPALATINGRSFGEGELLPVMYGTERLRIVVRAIRDGGITLDYEGELIQVPMKRPELGQKRSQEKTGPTEFLIKLGPGVQK